MSENVLPSMEELLKRAEESGYRKGQTDLLMPYDAESIEDLVENIKRKVRADAIDELMKFIGEVWFDIDDLNIIHQKAEQIKEQKNE